jgi:threonine synthase
MSWTTFDDCQAIVKALFNDHQFRDRVKLSGVNSINWARIMAQIVYYFSSAISLGAPDRPVSFTVPTGNFGNVFAGYVAKCMGLPIERLTIATNVNDILHRTLETGRYEVRISYNHADSRANNVPVTIQHAEGRSVVHVDQTFRHRNLPVYPQAWQYIS